MLLNLPDQFSHESLKDISFGNVDAKRDEALESLFYVSKNTALQKFKTGKYSIIVGEKGAGKTAIFRLFKDGKIQINDNVHECINDFIEAGIDLALYNSLITQLVRSNKQSKSNNLLKYQIVWELFFTYRLLLLCEGIPQFPTNLKSIKSNFEKFFSMSEKKGSILDFIKSFTIKNGFKISTMNPEQIEFFSEIGANENVVKENNEKDNLNKLSFNLSMYKEQINSFLKENNIVARIFIDKLDDFVTKENFEFQKLFLQSLLYIEESYFDTEFIKIHIFLRKDLYDRLDKTSIGSDKLESRKISITWSKNEISEFLARRILFLYYHCFGITRFEFAINEKKLYLDEKTMANQFEQKVTNSKVFELLKALVPNTIKKKIQKNSKNIPKRSRYLDEQFNEDIIFSIFPKEVLHLTRDGQSCYMNFIDFLISHTALASGKTNPRMVLMFCDTLFEEINNYYEGNSDLKIPFEDGSYKLIPDDLFLSVYPKFQMKIFDIFRQYDFKKNDYFVNLAKIISTKQSIKESELIVKMKVPTQSKVETENFNRSLAFFVSSGVLGTETYIRNHSNRVYKIPIVFQKTIK